MWVNTLQTAREVGGGLNKARLVQSSAGQDEAPLTSEESNDQESFRSALTAFGIPFRLVPVDQVGDPAKPLSQVVFVPFASAKRLSDPAREALLQHLQTGGKLVLDGETKLASQLGIRFEGRRLPAKRIQDLNFPDVPVEWKRAGDFPRFAAPKGRQAAVC